MTTVEIISTSAVVIMAATSVLSNIFAGRKQRTEINWSFEPASKTEFKEHVTHNTQRHAELFKQIGHAEIKASKELKDAVTSVEQKIDLNYREVNKNFQETQRDLGRLLAETETQSAMIRDLARKQ